MNNVKLVVLLLAFSSYVHAACNNAFDFNPKKLHSNEKINFCEAFSGKVLLVVNTASRCGFTPQFRELEATYKQYREQGLEIVGFPSADFNQEYTEEEKIAEVCYMNYGVTFPMLAESSVRGPDTNPFFAWLSRESGHTPQWNFNKYLIDTNGKVIRGYPSHVTPENNEFRKTLLKALQKK
jgi:glutathione peroxidase